MVRYYKVDGYTDEDRDMVLEAIQRLAEQYECDAREQRDVLLAAYEARHFGYDDGSPVRH
ncbi:hypothetical protein BDI4_1280027 [Burkholderia diffusa]|nr:hypothetical protein BDI4_1280027 [Burkholderia diffusa]